MKSNLHIIEKDGLGEPLPFKNTSQLKGRQNYWLELYENNRDIVVEFLTQFNLPKQVENEVLEPWASTRVGIYNNVMIINLAVTGSENLGHHNYLTVIVMENLVITVLKEGSQLLNGLKQETNTNLLNLELSLFHMVYYIAVEVLQFDMELLTSSRKQVNKLSLSLDDNPDSVPYREIIICKREINQLSNLIEDQFSMLGFVPKLNWSDESNLIHAEFLSLVQGFGHIQNSFERLEEKMESIQNQYQLILQEKGNKRLNTLTVIQSVFVPLTFIAGIYGMNFQFMPELNWKYSYFLIWGIMIFITAFQLKWFKRKGWFN